MEEIEGHIETIVYKAKDTGFVVAKLKSNNHKELLTLLGVMFTIQAGEYIKAKGEWQNHPQHGKQFYVQELEIVQPSTIFGIQKYLESGLIEGIGPVYAKKIVATFGENTLEILENAPLQLRNIPGIGEKRIQQIIASWKEQRSIRDCMIFLQGLHISPAYAQKIYSVFQEQSVHVVQTRPYDLAKQIVGIGFKMADMIALRVGFPKESLERRVAGMCHVLWENQNKGHTCLEVSLLLNESAQILEAEEEKMQEALTQALQENLIVLEKNPEDNITYVWDSRFYAMEKKIAQQVQRIQRHPAGLRTVHTSKAIAWVEEKLHLQLAEEQKLAITACLEKKLHFVIGGPGTGKSTITLVLITILSAITRKIVLAAPTGRAAKRLTQITRKKALTIHSLLEPDFVQKGFKRNRKNPLIADFLIIDEASMIDTPLLLALLCAIPDHTRVLFIGDVDQLPSVGPGSVLQDLLESGVVSITKLEKIFRQAAGSKIVVNAHKINQGQFPDLGQFPWSDFHFYHEKHSEIILSEILDLVQNKIPQKKRLHPVWDIQILSPMKKGPLGTEKLNEALQNALNPQSCRLRRRNTEFRLHDKVMQIKNNYQKKVYNGELGEIVDIDAKNSCIKIAFEEGKIVEYAFSEIEELQLAYAISIHKAQGSEFSCVIVVVHPSHWALLCRNLLYTAVTRGKIFVILIGTKQAIGIAVNNKQALCRKTGLKQALQQQKALEQPDLPLVN